MHQATFGGVSPDVSKRSKVVDDFAVRARVGQREIGLGLHGSHLREGQRVSFDGWVDECAFRARASFCRGLESTRPESPPLWIRSRRTAMVSMLANSPDEMRNPGSYVMAATYRVGQVWVKLSVNLPMVGPLLMRMRRPAPHKAAAASPPARQAVTGAHVSARSAPYKHVRVSLVG